MLSKMPLTSNGSPTERIVQSTSNQGKTGKYIPPAKRRPSDSSSNKTNSMPSPNFTSFIGHSASSSGTSPQFRERNRWGLPPKLNGYYSPESPRIPCSSGVLTTTASRTPSPLRLATRPILGNAEGTHPERIWQGQRKGGNRAPHLEPEGTTSWRRKSEVQDKVPLIPSTVEPQIAKGVQEEEEEQEEQEEREEEEEEEQEEKQEEKHEKREDDEEEGREAKVEDDDDFYDEALVWRIKMLDFQPYVDEGGTSSFFEPPAGRTRSRLFGYFNSDAYKKKWPTNIELVN